MCPLEKKNDKDTSDSAVVTPVKPVLFAATNPENASEVAQALQDSFTLVYAPTAGSSSDAGRQQSPSVPNDYTSCVEQAVCARAALFVATQGSR